MYTVIFYIDLNNWIIRMTGYQQIDLAEDNGQ